LTLAVPTPNPVNGLLTPEAVRERCNDLFRIGLDGGLPWFQVDIANLHNPTSRVVGEIESNYPTLEIPLHSRWRHFELGGTDLWEDLSMSFGLSGDRLAIAAGDLAVVSVLLDAGAGPDWVYADDSTGLKIGRSEGLALASLRLFESGMLSDYGDDPLRADAAALTKISARMLADAFQVTGTNPLVGLQQRAGLLQKLGYAIEKHSSFYARDNEIRPGNLILKLAARPNLEARDILVAVLGSLMDIWPSPVRIAGNALGDVGHHRALSREDETDCIVPFHKLSQWLSYSLVEPLEQMEATVSNLDGLTGLAEYRNGGLFIDTGVLRLKDESLLSVAHKPESELIVEWRALTVALLDLLAEEVRKSLNLDIGGLTLGHILQGGTWSAGRKIAWELRSDGSPPIRLDSDATVF
tara:strand:- start:2285 stop:3517 length:1233 start_codon:yes stop_codon:yes gene_type:complete